MTAPATASIKATYFGGTKSDALSIKPVQPTAIALTPPVLKGGTQSTATITINGPAPVGGASIVVRPVVVRVNTTSVTANTVATIKATAGGVSKSANLTIQP